MHARVLILAKLLLLLAFSTVRSAELARVRFFPYETYLRVVIDLDAIPEYNVWVPIDPPDRIAIDLLKTTISFKPKSISVQDSLVKDIRINSLTEIKQQVVLDLVQPAKYIHFALGNDPVNKRPYRIVIDVLRQPEAQKEELIASETLSIDTTAIDSSIESTESKPVKKIRVIIDSGHGGMDPGAVSSTGIEEKTIVLKVAKLLAKYLEKYQGFVAVFTRQTDIFIPLRERITSAKQLHGDVFISIHCNATRYKKSKMQGTEIYFLGPKGASDEITRELEDYENNADFRAGYVSVSEDEDSLLAKIIMEAQASEIGIRRSSLLAESVYDQVQTVLKGRGVKQANFVVLKGLTLPSILVEIAYLSHSSDLKLLENEDFLNRYASKLAKGIVDYFQSYGGLGDYEEGPAYYIVKSGDTLSEIAQQYGVSVEALKEENSLESAHHLKIGQRLIIPAD